MKRNILYKLVTLTVTIMLLIQSTAVFAVEDNILGVPLEKFNGITDSSSRLNSTLEYYDKNEGNIGYYLKYKLDAYRYMYEILSVATQLGENKVNVIPEHVANYNKLLREPLTEKDQIDATIVSNDDYKIKTETSVAINKLIGLVGQEGQLKDSDGNDLITFYAELGRVRQAVGMSVTVDGGDNVISESDNDKAVEYIIENISNIRYLFTALKEYIVEYSSRFGSSINFDKLEEHFVITYNEIMRVSIEHDVKGITNLDLWGDVANFKDNLDGQALLEMIGVWKEVDGEEDMDQYRLSEYSEYMLKGIAASATFRPFETNLNTTEGFSFLGEESSTFHEMHGTTRKLLLTISDSYNNLNNGLNLKSVKSLKMMTLRKFVENTDEPKILYLDNKQYNIAELEEAQKAIKEKDLNSTDITDDNELKDVIGVTEKEDGKDDRGFFSKAIHYVEATTKKGINYLNNKNSFFDFLILDYEFYNTDNEVETLVFASGKPQDLGVHNKQLKDLKEKVNAGYLVYKNIMEEYWSTGTKLKMAKDLDKPIYIDTYGNIVSASGIVIIPAIANPFYYKDGYPTYFFNRAFIESYPEYTITDGNFKVSSKDKNKVALYFHSNESIFGLNKFKDSIKEINDILKYRGVSVSEISIETELNNAENKVKAIISSSDENNNLKVTNITSSFVETDLPAIFSVDLRVGSATKDNSTKNNSVGLVQPIAYKFDNSYEPIKSLDIFSFPNVNGYDLESYYDLAPISKRIYPSNNLAIINDYTVKLTYKDTSSSQVVTFKEVPDSDELKRFIYITNLENIAKIENNEIKDKGVLDNKLYAITKQVFLFGIKDTNTINSLIPDTIRSLYSEYEKFLLEKANSRYENALGDDVSNNITYSRSLEEINSLKGILPLVYKILLFVSIVAIIINLILTVVIQESRLRQLVKVVTVLYLVTFFINGSSWIFGTTVNVPTRWMFKGEAVFWTIIEQEKLANRKELTTEDEVREVEDDYGSQVKLFKIPYNYPFKLISTRNNSNALTLDEFYENYLNNEGLYRAQNNEMYVDGSYLVIDTKTIFDSSSIVVRDPEKDVFLKLEHEVYNNPELAYYMPYYMFIDNIVYNLNTLTELTTKIPTDITYANGDKKTTGRIYDYINSAMFLDYDEYLKRIEEYETSDKVSEELSIAEIKRITEQYGNNNDFLGIRKILGLTNEKDLAPFTKEGLEKIKFTGWYPHLPEVLALGEEEDLEKRAKRVNDKVRMFMMQLGELSKHVADEHLIKTIALYASFEFNKEFNHYAINKGPVGIELSNIPLERLMMAMSLPREELIDSSVTTYPNKVLEREGYVGLHLSTINDILTLVINHAKPFFTVLLWSLTALIIFFRKVIIPDPTNRSILGSLKLIFVLVICSLVYNIGIVFCIKLVNWTSSMLLSQTVLLILNLAFVGGLVFLTYALIRDIWNLGNSVVMKGLEGVVKSYANSFVGAVSSLPLVEKYFGKYVDNSLANSKHLAQYFEQKSIKSAEQLGSVEMFDPINFSTKALDKVKVVVNKRRQSNNNYYQGGRTYDKEYNEVELPNEYRTRNRVDNRGEFFDDVIIDVFGREQVVLPRKKQKQSNRDYTVINSSTQLDSDNRKYNKEEEVDYLNNK